MTFCSTLALRRIITRKLSQIKIPRKRHLFREIVQGESETIDKLAVRLGKKPSNVNNVITEIKWRPKFEIKSSQTVGQKSCDVKFWRNFRLSVLNFVRTGSRNYEVVKRQTERTSLSIGPVNQVLDSLRRKNSENSSAQTGSECYRRGRKVQFAKDVRPVLGKRKHA